MLINANQCRDRELNGRELFVGVSITRDESLTARRVAENAFLDAAAQIAGQMPTARKAPR